MARRATISATRFRSAATRSWSERREPRSAATAPGGGLHLYGARRRLGQHDPDRQAHRLRRRGERLFRRRFRSAAARWWSERRATTAQRHAGGGLRIHGPGTGWANMTQTAKLAASDGAAGDDFGYSVSISGNTVVVGAARGTTPAYVFTEPACGLGQHDPNRQAYRLRRRGAASAPGLRHRQHAGDRGVRRRDTRPPRPSNMRSYVVAPSPHPSTAVSTHGGRSTHITRSAGPSRLRSTFSADGQRQRPPRN